MAMWSPGAYPVLDTQGEKSNPTPGTVLADTGALPGGVYHVTAIASSTSAAMAKWFIQSRDSANSANVGDVPTFYTYGTVTADVGLEMMVNEGGRFRIMADTVSGTCAGTIVAVRRF